MNKRIVNTCAMLRRYNEKGKKRKRNKVYTKYYVYMNKKMLQFTEAPTSSITVDTHAISE